MFSNFLHKLQITEHNDLCFVYHAGYKQKILLKHYLEMYRRIQIILLRLWFGIHERHSSRKTYLSRTWHSIFHVSVLEFTSRK